MNKQPAITRKPYNTWELATVFAANLSRCNDQVGNVRTDTDFWFINDGHSRFVFESYGTPIAIMSPNGLVCHVVNKTYSSSTSGHRNAVLGAMFRQGFHATGKAIWHPDMAASRWYRSDSNIEYTEYRRSAKDRDKAMRDVAAEYKASTRKSTYVPVKDRPKPPPYTWYKVLDKDGFAKDGGMWRYDLPVLNDDGTWTPGAWTPETNPKVCHSGWHVTNWPKKWIDSPTNRVFACNVRGKSDYTPSDAKCAFESIQPICEISLEEALAVKRPQETRR